MCRAMVWRANPLPISDFDGIYEKNLGILTLGALVT